jgi:hypothetical protein
MKNLVWTRAWKCVAFCAVLIVVCGCGLIPIPGGTIAKSPPLSWDVKKVLLMEESQAGVPATAYPTIKDTKRISIDDKGEIKELWVVDRKGQAINYIVTFTPAGQGVWQFRVVPEERPVESKP